MTAKRFILIAIIAIIAFPFFRSSKLEKVQPGDAVVVTGSSSGIGKHAALSLAKEGYTVFACVRKMKDGDALLESARKFEVDTEKIKIMILDVTNSDHIAKGVQMVSEYVGDRGLKGLFNNAGVGSDYTSAEFTSMDSFRWIFDVNYFGLVETTKAFLELLRKGKGRIIMNTSVAGFMGFPFMSPYTSSKHAVEGFSDSLRRELLPHGVKVSVLECGFITTPILSTGTPPKGISPYKEQELAAYNGGMKNAIGAPTPKVSSAAVIHAMRAVKPKLRYVVGKDFPLLILLKYVPTKWIDALLTVPYESISEEEMQELEKMTNMEFEL